MSTGPRYFIPFRRRREGRTDYYARGRLLLSENPRMVVRKTNREIIIQLMVPDPTGDRTLVAAYSRDLPGYGYTGSRSNTPAAYLTGILFGARCRKAGYGSAVLDIGLARASPGARVFAALKGAVKAGLSIPHSTEVLPDDSRVRGEHIAGFAPQRAGELSENVDKVAEAIMKEVS
ncbi:MAG TPA: 50S ribosomal protein L18 [Methanomicrobiales archaeon]|nr:50S ribosomal protein L18 [Methanomicrobiales archaeon]